MICQFPQKLPLNVLAFLRISYINENVSALFLNPYHYIITLKSHWLKSHEQNASFSSEGLGGGHTMWILQRNLRPSITVQ